MADKSLLPRSDGDDLGTAIFGTLTAADERRDHYTHTANGRTWRLYGCAKRGCDRINPDYETFATREGKGYCLSHIPLRSRLRLWWQERRNG